MQLRAAVPNLPCCLLYDILKKSYAEFWRMQGSSKLPDNNETHVSIHLPDDALATNRFSQIAAAVAEECSLSLSGPDGTSIDVPMGAAAEEIAAQVRERVNFQMPIVTLNGPASFEEAYQIIQKTSRAFDAPILMQWNAVEFVFAVGDTEETFRNKFSDCLGLMTASEPDTYFITSMLRSGASLEERFFTAQRASDLYNGKIIYPSTDNPNDKQPYIAARHGEEFSNNPVNRMYGDM